MAANAKTDDEVFITAIDHDGKRYGAAVVPMEFGAGTATLSVPCIIVCVSGNEAMDGGLKRTTLRWREAVAWLTGHGLPSDEATAIVCDAIRRQVEAEEYNRWPDVRTN